MGQLPRNFFELWGLAAVEFRSNIRQFGWDFAFFALSTKLVGASAKNSCPVAISSKGLTSCTTGVVAGVELYVKSRSTKRGGG